MSFYEYARPSEEAVASSDIDMAALLAIRSS